MSVAILMSTYNGEKYIQGQLDSIVNQTYIDWRLYIRDDGSSDRTKDIIKKNALKDERIIFINANYSKNIGVVKSFFSLLEFAKANYYMFCDQDDIWLPNKIECTVQQANVQDMNIPLLVHTNMTTFSDNLGIINRRFYGNSSIDNLNRMVSSNSVTGCTMLINNSMKSLIINDANSNIIMHDWWIGLCAASIGHIVYIESPTIMYRLHNDNLVGTDTNLKDRMRRLFNYNHEISRQKNAILQSRLLLLNHSNEMISSKRRIIEIFVDLNNQTFFKRMNSIIRFKLKKNSILGNISLLNIYAFNNMRLNKSIVKEDCDLNN